MIRPVEAQLLVPLVHFLHLLRTEHVGASLLINRADELLALVVARTSLVAKAEAEDGRQEDSHVSHYNPLAIVLFLLHLLVSPLGRRPSNRL